MVDASARQLRATCVVCGEPADITTERPGLTRLAVCRDANCRMNTDRQERMPPEEFRHFLSLHSQLLRSRRAALKHHQRLLQEKTDAESAEETRWWEHVTQLEPVRSLTNPLRLTIPSGPDQSTDQIDERRQRFAAHLQTLMTEVNFADEQIVSVDDQLPVAELTPDRLAQKLCQLCRGGCCQAGGDTALLSAATIRRVLSTQPDMDLSRLIERYLDLVPDQSMANSCIYHTTQGCALSRDLRSDICNDFCCSSLISLLDARSRTDTPQSEFVVLQRGQNHRNQNLLGVNNDIVTAVLITETEVVPLDPPQAPEANHETKEN